MTGSWLNCCDLFFTASTCIRAFSSFILLLLVSTLAVTEVIFNLTDDLSPDIVMMLLFSLLWVHCDGCWHAWHKLIFSAEHIEPSGPLRRPLLGVFDIFRPLVSHSRKKASQRSRASSWSRVLLSGTKVYRVLDQRKRLNGQTGPAHYDAGQVWRSCHFGPSSGVR